MSDISCSQLYSISRSVISPAAQWPEWITSVPLLIYSAVAVEQKEALNVSDKLIIFSTFVTMLCGYLVNVKPPHWVAVLLISISCICVSGIFAIVLRARANYGMMKSAIYSETHHRIKAVSIAIATQQNNLALLLLITMPCFPIVYFLGVGKVISDDVQYSITMILGMVAKVLFASMSAEGHIKATEGTINALEAEVVDAKEAGAYAEHLFQRVSLPLQSVMSGLHLLSQSPTATTTNEDATTLRFLQDTTQFINTSLYELEQGDRKTFRSKEALRLSPSLFVVNELLMRVIVPFQKKLASKKINCKLHVDDSVPKEVVGDVVRLEFCLHSILEEAVKVSQERAKLILAVSGDAIGNVRTSSTHSEKRVVAVTFQVLRKAGASEDERAIFDTDDIATVGDNGALRGLKLCRAIVRLHGGRFVTGSSTDNVLTFAFGFSIPFEIAGEAWGRRSVTQGIEPVGQRRSIGTNSTNPPGMTTADEMKTESFHDDA